MCAGVLTANQMLTPYRERVWMLEEGEYLFRLMESEICYHRQILPEICYELSCKTKSRWNLFFYNCTKNYPPARTAFFGKSMRKLSKRP